MGTLKTSAGFTIIEVMLFLAVSGALAVGVLATSTVGINNQRYQDAVNSFKSIVQEEFTNTTRVINSRQGQAACVLEPTNSQLPGATNCIVIGRLMTVKATGEIQRSNIIGRIPAGSPTTDKQAIQQATPVIDSTSVQTSVMNWGTTPRRSGAPQALSVVIFRSPLSGNVVAYVQTQTSLIETDAQLRLFVDTASNTTDKLICIDPSGWTVAQMQAVVITARAAGPSGVEQRAVEEAECN